MAPTLSELMFSCLGNIWKKSNNLKINRLFNFGALRCLIRVCDGNCQRLNLPYSFIYLFYFFFLFLSCGALHGLVTHIKHILTCKRRGVTMGFTMFKGLDRVVEGFFKYFSNLLFYM